MKVYRIYTEILDKNFICISDNFDEAEHKFLNFIKQHESYKEYFEDIVNDDYFEIEEIRFNEFDIVEHSDAF